MGLICKVIARVRQHRFLVTSLMFIPKKTTKVYEDNEEVVMHTTTNKITPQRRHIHLPLAYLHYDHTKGMFKALQTPSII